MAGYVDSVLLKGEALVYSARKSLWHYLLRFILGGVLLVVFVPAAIVSLGAMPLDRGISAFLWVCAALGLALIAWPFIVVRMTELAITSKRVIVKYGVFTTSTLEIRFDKIESVRVQRGLGGRIFGYGDIDIRGTGSTFDPITSIAHPQVFKANLDRVMHPEPVAAAA